MAYTLAELADHVGGRIDAGHDCLISGVATLLSAKEGDISFLANSRYRKFLTASKASAVIVAEEDAALCSGYALISHNPYLAYARIATLLYPPLTPMAGQHASAVIAADAEVHASAAIGAYTVIESGAKVGANVVLGAGCSIGREACIGAGSKLMANVSVYDGCQIGERCLLHSGVVIGADGFGIAPDGDAWVKVPQLGRVVIGDDVEVGANTTIDRGALEDTVIGNGVKLDNQIQIAHNVVIGDHTVIAACTGVSGSVNIGRHCMIAGGVGIAGHLDIADGVTITGMSMVTKSIKEKGGVYSSGWGAQPQASWHRQVASLRRLPAMMRQGEALSKLASE